MIYQCKFPKITVTNSKLTSSKIFKREVNTHSLSPISPTIDQETIDPNIPNISTKSDDISQDTVDTALDYISDNNNSTNELTVRLKRKSHDSLSNSEENILTKKAKLSHENDNNNDNISVNDSIELSHDNDNTSVNDSIELPHDNTSVIDSIELDTSVPGEITNTQLSEVASNTTNSLAETANQLETQMNNLANYMIAQKTQAYEAFRLIDDIESALDLFEVYRGALTAKVEQIEQNILAHNLNIINESEVDGDIPILDNNSESTRSDSWDNNSEQNNLNDTFEPNILDDEQNNWENNSEFNNLDNDPDNLDNTFEPNLLDNNFRPNILDNNFRPDIFNSLEDDNFDISSDGSSIFNEIIENVGMEPLDNGVLINQVIYSDQIRADDIIYSNYIIHMRGIDNLDYRMVYEDIVECLNNLDLLIAEYQALEATEKAILPLVNGLFDIEYELVSQQISSILELLSRLL